MRTDRSTRQTRIACAARFLAVLAVLQACLFTLAPPATSHVRVETDPVSGSRHEVGPRQIHLRFNKPVHPDQVTVSLRPAGGQARPLQLDQGGEGRRLDYTASLDRRLARASYTIEVSASADGHYMQYRSYFVVGPGPIVKQGPGAGDTNQAAALLNRTGSPLGLIALVGIGMLFTATLIGAPRSTLAAAARAARYCVWFGLAAVALHLTAVILAKDGAFSAVYGTQVGRLLLLQLLMFGLVLWTADRLIAVPALSQRRGTWENVLAVVGMVLTLTYAARSHAAGDEWSFMSLMVAMVHLGAVSLWLSGLLALATVASRNMLEEVPAVMLTRFSRLVRWCAGLAIASGIFLAFRLSDGFDTAALASTFGAALIGKSAMVAVLAFCAWRTHQALAVAGESTVPAIATRNPEPATTTSTGTLVLSPARASTRIDDERLRRHVLTETRLALAVLIAANIMAVWAH